MLAISAVDGTEIRAFDEGQGRTIMLVGPGLDDGRRCARLAASLARRFRVLRPQRRQYRLDLKSRDGAGPCSMDQEAADLGALARTADEPVVVYGHSSGGVAALEALVAYPELFAGAVIFEAPVVIGTALGGTNGEVLATARAELAAGRPGRAMAVFFRDTVGLPPRQASLAGAATALVPRYRRLVGAQLDDLEAIDRLGVRLDAYAGITLPVVLLGGDRSPANLAERLDTLAQVMPDAKRVVMPGRDHCADLKARTEVAQVIETLADQVFDHPA